MGLSKNNFSTFTATPEELANKVLQEFNKIVTITFPIDPFKLLSEFHVIYKFQNFERLEGVYLVPIDEKDLPIVGINNNRPITRQRFTAAHELCHHIKDKGTQYCPLDGRKSIIEKFADKFAANILMPLNELDQVSSRFLKDGFIKFEDAIFIADYFGVGFQACIYRLAYDLKRISGDIEGNSLLARINEFKPDKKRITLGLNKYELPLLRNILNKHSMFYENENDITWHNFKNNFVYNENRLEGINLDLEVVSEIITDLRLMKQESEFCKSEYQTIIEVAGHSSLFDYVSETADEISVFSLLRLHKIMYQYSLFPDDAGKTREVNNLVIDSKFETCDHTRVVPELLIVENEVKRVMENKGNLSIVNYIDAVIRIHHRLTQIHPFMDGNGRITRVFLSWMFRKKNLPPVYIKVANKYDYFNALSIADLENDYDKLYEIFYREIIRSLIELNEKYRWGI